MVWIYSVMTREAFIKVLKREDYSYEIEGDRIIVTGEVDVYLESLTSLPPGVVFRNGGDVYLTSLTSIPPGVEFKNKGDAYLHFLPSLPHGVVFKNGGFVDLESLTSISPGVEFKNEVDVYLESLTSLPPGVEFKNGGDVLLDALIGDWFSDWEGNIEGIDSNYSKRLLNSMIALGLFDR